MLPPPWLMAPAVGWEARPAADGLSSSSGSTVATAAQEHASSVAEDGSKVPEPQVVEAAAEKAVVVEVSVVVVLVLVVAVVLVLVVAVVVEILAVQVEEEAVARGPPALGRVRAGFAESLLLLGQVLQGSA